MATPTANVVGMPITCVPNPNAADGQPGGSTSSGGGGLVGDGPPEGVVTAPEGTTYLDRLNDNFYAKRTGSDNTGWVPLIR